MLRLIKYQYRKDLPMYIVIFSVIMALASYLALSIAAESEFNMVFAMILYILCGSGAVIFIMILGVISYSKEINSKSSFMTFMTPLSTFEIVGAKYITLIVTTVVTTALYAGGGYLNIMLAVAKFNEINDIRDMLDYMLTLFDSSFTEIMSTFFVAVFSVWLTILLTVSYAYLAITLSSTILANRRGKGWLAVGLFVGIIIFVNLITNIIPKFDFGDSFVEQFLSNWLVYLFEILLIIGTYFGVSILLKKKVSL